MGSDEAGAASALRGLGSEPCGSVYDHCGLPSRAALPNWQRCDRLNPDAPDANAQAC